MAAKQPWRHYQDAAALLLRELGFAVQIEDQITSARGVVHEVDVSARRVVAGVGVLWVVECKLWSSRVGKEKVAALSAVCEDLGADRGLLMSESGFQSGALQMAVGRNITLTSLEDLRANAAADLQSARERQARDHLRSAETALSELRSSTIGESFGEIVKVMYLLGLSREEHAQRADEPQARATREDILAVQELVHSRYPEIAQKIAAYQRRSTVQVERRVKLMLETRVPGAINHAEVEILSKRAAAYRANLDDGALARWPVLAKDEGGTFRTTWCMRQLLDVLEGAIRDLSQRVDTHRRQ